MISLQINLLFRFPFFLCRKKYLKCLISFCLLIIVVYWLFFKDDDQYEGLEGKDLSFSSLLAAHGRRRSERSVSYSSCSWSDVSIGSETLPRRPLSVNPSISKGLLVVSVESRGREVTFVEHYTSSHLMTLPPIFLAASRGRSTPVVLLLQHGAKGNIAVNFFPFYSVPCILISFIYHGKINVIIIYCFTLYISIAVVSRRSLTHPPRLFLINSFKKYFAGQKMYQSFCLLACMCPSFFLAFDMQNVILRRKMKAKTPQYFFLKNVEKEKNLVWEPGCIAYDIIWCE